MSDSERWAPPTDRCAVGSELSGRPHNERSEHTFERDEPTFARGEPTFARGEPPFEMNIRARVIRAIDGDTVWVRVRVRLLSDAPETGTAPGDAATRAAQRRYHPGAPVQIVGRSVDSYGRILGTLITDDSGLNVREL